MGEAFAALAHKETSISREPSFIRGNSSGSSIGSIDGILYHSKGNRNAESSARKRPSRAGTRSVTTLSAAQLERKRANDREAQRAIRQRTKDHIEHLERNILELRSMQDNNEKLVLSIQRRNQELEEENAYLRAKLGETGFPLSIS